MELMSVDIWSPPPITLAVAKKFTVPPIKEAQRQLAATAASCWASPSDGKVRKTKNDDMHPRMDPMEPNRKETPTFRMIAFRCIGDPDKAASCPDLNVVVVVSLLGPPNKRNARDAGRKVVQQRSYK